MIPETVQFINNNQTTVIWPEERNGYCTVTFGQGSSGTAGADGTLTSSTLKYSFDTNINTSGPSLSYPGSGDIKFNSTNLGNATEVFINPIDNGGINVAQFFRDVDNTDSAVKFNMKVTKIGSENDFVTFHSTSTFTETTFDGVTYFKNSNLS